MIYVSKLKSYFQVDCISKLSINFYFSEDWIWTFEKFLKFFRKTRISRILSNCWWWSGLTLIFEAIRINYMLQFHTCSLFLDFIKWYFVSFHFFLWNETISNLSKINSHSHFILKASPKPEKNISNLRHVPLKP